MRETVCAVAHIGIIVEQAIESLGKRVSLGKAVKERIVLLLYSLQSGYPVGAQKWAASQKLHSNLPWDRLAYSSAGSV